MKTKKQTRLTLSQIKEKLGVCRSRVMFRYQRGDFPNAEFCECGKSILVPESDLKQKTKPKTGE